MKTLRLQGLFQAPDELFLVLHAPMASFKLGNETNRADTKECTADRG